MSTVSSPAAHGHASLGPSSSSRWLTCPASVRRSVGRGTGSSPAAERGTRCHALAEAALTAEFEVDLDRFVDYWVSSIEDWRKEYPDATDLLELCGVADVYFQAVREAAEELGPDTLALVERRVSVPNTHDEVWGTADCILYSEVNEAVHVLDLKAGKGVRVVAPDNPQLRLYALGAIALLDPDREWVKDVYVSIVQPAFDGVTSAYYTANDLYVWNGWVQARVEDALAEHAPARPSDTACRWCPVRDECPEYLEHKADSWFGSGGVQPAPPKDSVGPDELSRHLELAEGAREYVRAVERAANAFSPERLPDGWRAVTRSRAKVSKPAVLADRLRRVGVEPTETRLRSLTDLKKAVGPAFYLVAGDAVEVTETTSVRRAEQARD